MRPALLAKIFPFTKKMSFCGAGCSGLTLATSISLFSFNDTSRCFCWSYSHSCHWMSFDSFMLLVFTETRGKIISNFISLSSSGICFHINKCWYLWDYNSLILYDYAWLKQIISVIYPRLTKSLPHSYKKYKHVYAVNSLLHCKWQHNGFTTCLEWWNNNWVKPVLVGICTSRRLDVKSFYFFLRML